MIETRAALVNTKGGKVLVGIRGDGLYRNVTPEKLQTNTYQASTRNKQIAEAFYLTHNIEKSSKDIEKITFVEETLLREIADNKFVSIPELSEKVKINIRNTKNNISKLKSKVLLKRTGPDRGDYWQVYR